MHRKAIFNFIAKVCRIIIDQTNDSFFRNHNALSQEKSDKIKGILRREFPEIYIDSTYAYECLFDARMLARLDQFCDRCEAGKDYHLLLRLLIKLTSILKDIIKGFQNCFEQEQLMIKDEKGFKWSENCLNDNVEVCRIQLLPKCVSYWAHTSKDKNGAYSIKVLSELWVFP